MFTIRVGYRHFTADAVRGGTPADEVIVRFTIEVNRRHEIKSTNSLLHQYMNDISQPNIYIYSMLKTHASRGMLPACRCRLLESRREIAQLTKETLK